MKTIIQLFIFSILIVLSFFFYKNYFAKNVSKNETVVINKKLENADKIEKLESININKKEKNVSEVDQKFEEKVDKTNSSIQNLSYKVKLPDDKEYEIFANLSELSYKDNAEIMIMKNVVARFIDKDKKIIKIEADEAIFYNSSYNTNFNKNVKIEYLKNRITSNKLSYDFKKNEILISDNIIYKGIHGTIIADNILINILSEDINVFMNNSEEKIKIKSY